MEMFTAEVVAWNIKYDFGGLYIDGYFKGDHDNDRIRRHLSDIDMATGVVTTFPELYKLSPWTDWSYLNISVETIQRILFMCDDIALTYSVDQYHPEFYLDELGGLVIEYTVNTHRFRQVTPLYDLAVVKCMEQYIQAIILSTKEEFKKGLKR